MFIVKVPGINGKKSKGCERAGNAILKTLKEEIHSNEQNKPIEFALLDLEEIHLDNSDLGITNNLIYDNSLETFETKPRTIFLGGDGSISYSILRAFRKYCENERKKPCLIVFDSHADCLKTENEFPENREWIRKLIENGFPKENILIAGLRNIKKEEIEFLSKKGVRTISMTSLTDDLTDMCDAIMEFANGKELYVSIDIDVVDPVFAPSTAYPEAGGLTARQFIYLMQRIKKIKSLKGIDITEINELNDKKTGNPTVRLGAKILAEML